MCLVTLPLFFPSPFPRFETHPSFLFFFFFCYTIWHCFISYILTNLALVSFLPSSSIVPPAPNSSLSLLTPWTNVPNSLSLCLSHFANNFFMNNSGSKSSSSGKNNVNQVLPSEFSPRLAGSPKLYDERLTCTI